MAYQPKEGYGNLFRNTDKKTETAPDYKGSIMHQAKSSRLTPGCGSTILHTDQQVHSYVVLR
jgi:hypothetical protein